MSHGNSHDDLQPPGAPGAQGAPARAGAAPSLAAFAAPALAALLALLALVALPAWGGPLRAQAPDSGVAAPAAAAAGDPTSDSAGARAAAAARRVAGRGIRPLAVGKWTTLAVAVGAAVYGYSENRLADSRYEDLDRLCQAEPVRCEDRTPGGAYADPGLESRFQEVRRLDRRATVGLVGAEIGLASSLVLFLLDLRHAGHDPPDIPYVPRKLRVTPGRAGALELGVRLPVPFRRPPPGR